MEGAKGQGTRDEGPNKCGGVDKVAWSLELEEMRPNLRDCVYCGCRTYKARKIKKAEGGDRSAPFLPC